VPEDDLWVNLSPYEKDRIIPQTFGSTEMGRDLLAQDYLLKQLTASLMYPEDQLGKLFWEKVYKKAYQQYGTTELPYNTFNKVWIMPETATVYENEDTAYVIESRLKVMLDEDYLALDKNINAKNLNKTEINQKDIKNLNNLSSSVIRSVILPAIEKEVNEGESFANLRQIYSSLILATWFKRNLKESLLGKVYVDQNKISGFTLKDKNIKEKIYQQYLKAFKKGVYDYVQEDFEPATQQIIPRKYFSGGAVGKMGLEKLQTVNELSDRAMAIIESPKNPMVEVAMRGDFLTQPIDSALTASQIEERAQGRGIWTEETTVTYPNGTIERRDPQGRVIWASIFLKNKRIDVIRAGYPDSEDQTHISFEIWLDGKKIDILPHNHNGLGFNWGISRDRNGENVLSLQLFYIAEEFQGKGIGLAILEWLKEHAFSKNINNYRNFLTGNPAMLHRHLTLLEKNSTYFKMQNTPTLKNFVVRTPDEILKKINSIRVKYNSNNKKINNTLGNIYFNDKGLPNIFKDSKGVEWKFFLKAQQKERKIYEIVRPDGQQILQFDIEGIRMRLTDDETGKLYPLEYNDWMFQIEGKFKSEDSAMTTSQLEKRAENRGIWTEDTTVTYPNGTMERRDIQGSVIWATIPSEDRRIDVIRSGYPNSLTQAHLFFEIWMDGERIDVLPDNYSEFGLIWGITHDEDLIFEGGNILNLVTFKLLEKFQGKRIGSEILEWLKQHAFSKNIQIYRNAGTVNPAMLYRHLTLLEENSAYFTMKNMITNESVVVRTPDEILRKIDSIKVKYESDQKNINNILGKIYFNEKGLPSIFKDAQGIEWKIHLKVKEKDLRSYQIEWRNGKTILQFDIEGIRMRLTDQETGKLYSLEYNDWMFQLEGKLKLEDSAMTAFEFEGALGRVSNEIRDIIEAINAEGQEGVNARIFFLLIDFYNLIKGPRRKLIIIKELKRAIDESLDKTIIPQKALDFLENHPEVNIPDRIVFLTNDAKLLLKGSKPSPVKKINGKLGDLDIAIAPFLMQKDYHEVLAQTKRFFEIQLSSFNELSKEAFRLSLASHLFQWRRNFLSQMKEREGEIHFDAIVESAGLLGFGSKEISLLSTYKSLHAKKINITFERIAFEYILPEFRKYKKLSANRREENRNKIMLIFTETINPLLEGFIELKIQAQQLAEGIENESLSLLTLDDVYEVIEDPDVLTYENFITYLIELTGAAEQKVLSWLKDLGFNGKNDFLDAREETLDAKFESQEKPLELKGYSILVLANNYTDFKKLRANNKQIIKKIDLFVDNPSSGTYTQTIKNLKRVKLKEGLRLYLRIFSEEKTVVIVGFKEKGEVDKSGSNGFIYSVRKYFEKISTVESVDKFSNLMPFMVDSAIVANKDPLGGIDLNPDNLHLKTKGNGINLSLPFSGLPCLDHDGDGQCEEVDIKELENMNIEGVSPVILKITPIINLPMILGLRKNTCPENGSSHPDCFDDRMPMIKPEEEVVMIKT